MRHIVAALLVACALAALVAACVGLFIAHLIEGVQW